MVCEHCMCSSHLKCVKINTSESRPTRFCFLAIVVISRRADYMAGRGLAGRGRGKPGATVTTTPGSLRGCNNNPDNFCYICGMFTPQSFRCNISANVSKAYHLYFKCKVGDQDKKWAPHHCCKSCDKLLNDWLRGGRNHMPFAIPMIWREPRDNITDCYFCLTATYGFTWKTRSKINYA